MYNTSNGSKGKSGGKGHCKVPYKKPSGYGGLKNSTEIRKQPK